MRLVPGKHLFIFVFLTGFINNASISIYGQTVNELARATDFVHEPAAPMDSAATADDVTSMYFNPAGIGIHPLQIGFYYGNNSQEQYQDYLGFLKFLGLAFSTRLRQEAAGFNAQKFTVGTGFETGKVWSIGTTYNWFYSSGGILNNYTQWDLGVIIRPTRWLSLGAVARDLNNPVFQGVEVKPSLNAGLALRLPIPKMTENLTVSADATLYFNPGVKTVSPRFMAELIPLSGFTIYGGVINFSDMFFGVKFSQNLTQLSFQGNIPQNRGQTYSGGILVSAERYKTNLEATRYYLEIPLNERYRESQKNTPFFLPEAITFYDLVSGIERAVHDPQVRGIIVRADNFSGGWAQAEELRTGLLRFQELSGKPVYAFMESGANKDYYIATAAEKIIMPPGGMLELTGLKAEVYYLRGLLDLVGIEPDFIGIGDYKSAPHMFTSKGSDKFEKEQMSLILENLQGELTRAILEKRKKIDLAKLERIFDRGILSANMAQETGIIDEVMYLPDIRQKYMGATYSTPPRTMDFQKYIKTKMYDDSWGPRPCIALLTLEGEITSSDSNIPIINDDAVILKDDTIEAIEKIRNDPAIKSVVIRINSPGGSGLASDVLWNEIRRLHQVKPVVISLGATAASGGYYLAVGADEIVADQTTITGSIGVFYGKFSLKELYKKLGINKETYKLYRNATIFSETDVFSADEKKLIQEELIEFYKLFMDRVQRNRTRLKKEDVVENANGRVYTGGEALKRGMVDKIGGLSVALEIARNKAHITDDRVEVRVFPVSNTGILSGSTMGITLPKSIRGAIKLLNEDEKNTSSQKILFLMPFDMDIQ